MDAVDCALLNITNNKITLTAYRQFPIDHTIRAVLKSINKDTAIGTICRLDVSLGKIFAGAVQSLIDESGIDKSRIAAIGSHGQTVFHHPQQPAACSLQIGDANIIANMTGITTVADLRRMDMAAGGEGAPLAPVIHEVLFRQNESDTVVVNIGGMANITILPSRNSNSAISGFDTGPGNVLMDEWIKLHKQQDYDRDGAWAASGNVDEDLLQQMLSRHYFSETPPKSTGRDDFNLDWLEGELATCNSTLPEADVQATLLALTTVSIADAVRQYAASADRVIICGGGAHNRQLMQALQETLTKYTVCSSAELGYNPDAIEAMAFAWLARCRLEGIPGNIPSVTGAKEPCLLGAVYKSTAE